MMGVRHNGVTETSRRCPDECNGRLWSMPLRCWIGRVENKTLRHGDPSYTNRQIEKQLYKAWRTSVIMTIATRASSGVGSKNLDDNQKNSGNHHHRMIAGITNDCDSSGNKISSLSLIHPNCFIIYPSCSDT